ncbi:MAG: YozQ family protein [Bacillus sp. (in: Bacteria)]|nr:YozQ family protein [Bacillus sp. (in: firmicutes)]
MANNKKNNKVEKIAEKNYEVEDYQSSDETAQGLAVTHEQVSDTFTEGTIDAKIDKLDDNGRKSGNDGEEIPRKGFDE